MLSSSIFIVHKIYEHAKSFNSSSDQGIKLSIQFGNIFAVRPLDWSDFPGQIDERLPWSAHIFWSI
jgi:hypothetical protein